MYQAHYAFVIDTFQKVLVELTHSNSISSPSELAQEAMDIAEAAHQQILSYNQKLIDFVTLEREAKK